MDQECANVDKGWYPERNTHAQKGDVPSNTSRQAPNLGFTWEGAAWPLGKGQPASTHPVWPPWLCDGQGGGGVKVSVLELWWSDSQNGHLPTLRFTGSIFLGTGN